jgi:hypothetical protein
MLRGEMTSPEQAEWDRATRASRYRRRPWIFGIVTGAIVCAAGYAAIAWYAEDMQDRANQGEVVYENRSAKTSLSMLLAPVLAGMGAFYAVFRLTGGKLAPEYERGLRS